MHSWSFLLYQILASLLLHTDVYFSSPCKIKCVVGKGGLRQRVTGAGAWPPPPPWHQKGWGQGGKRQTWLSHTPGLPLMAWLNLSTKSNLRSHWDVNGHGAHLTGRLRDLKEMWKWFSLLFKSEKNHILMNTCNNESSLFILIFTLVW